MNDAYKYMMQQNQVHKGEFQSKKIASLASFYWFKLKKPDESNTEIKSHIRIVLKN